MSDPKRTLLFSVTSGSMEWSFFRAGGKGGQNQNKRSTGVRCLHPPSGAVGEARDTREQHRNRQIAFRRCVETQEFKNWMNREIRRRLHFQVDIDKIVDEQMKQVRCEVRVNGQWQEDTNNGK